MDSSADLGPQLEGTVTALLETGRYTSRSEVLREGVRLVEERDRRVIARDAAIERGIADADAGSVKPVRDVAARLTAKYQGMAGRRSE